MGYEQHPNLKLDMVGLSMRCNYSPMISILALSKISPYISYIRNVKNYQIWESVSKIYSIIINRVYSQWIFLSPHFIVIALFLILPCFENNDRCVYNIDKFTLWWHRGCRITEPQTSVIIVNCFVMDKYKYTWDLRIEICFSPIGK